jgi:hypothetical protein
MVLAAARSGLDPNRAEAAEGHSQAWPSHHESVTKPRALSFDEEEASELLSNHQPKGANK